MKRIGLVGCVKAKLDTRQIACELYTSALFKGRRLYVETSCTEWWILSAKHGLVHPEELLSPYDFTLKKATKKGRMVWSKRVLEAINERIDVTAGDVFEIHAGIEYRNFGVAAGIRRKGCLVSVPTIGMGIGKQLKFYKEQNYLQQLDGKL